MLNFLIVAVKVIFLLGLLITMHESGHFIVAKLCKIKVNEFAIGFGPTIWKKQGKETKYAIRLIPLGGFVSMEGEEERSNVEGSFSNASAIKKIAIVAAGAIVNILFGIIVFYFLSVYNGQYISNTVDEVVDGYSASENGIISGDEIIKINKMKIKNKQDINNALEKYKNTELTIKIKRNNEIIDISMKPSEIKGKYTGIYLKSENGEAKAEILTIDSGSPADKAGLQAGDDLLKINDVDVNDNYLVLSEQIAKLENNQSLKMLIKRLGKEQEIEITPQEISSYYLGITSKMVEPTIQNRLYYSTLETRDFLGQLGQGISKLFTGKASVKQFTGPVGISELVADTSKISEFVYLLAVISLSLGVTNLLPFPPLDGGKIVLILIEKIRRKPLPDGFEVKIQMIGFSLMILLSIYVTFNDIVRIL